MNSYEHQRLRKQYYKSYDIPFCECGGTFHYDKTICEFVCDECGAVVKVIDRDRSKKGCSEKKYCKVCGKKLKGKQKKFCSTKCKDDYFNRKRKLETLNPLNRDWEEDKRQRMKDELNFNPENNFYQDDNYWRLGESTLKEHKAVDFDKERRYIKYEKKRLLNRR